MVPSLRPAVACGIAGLLFAGSPVLALPLTPAQGDAVLSAVGRQHRVLERISKALWQEPELGFQEVKSSALLQQELRHAGFEVQAGSAGMPTAFVASFRTGPGPVIALLAEFDALPALSQKASSDRDPVRLGAPGHACGHNLLAASTVASALAVREAMIAQGVKGEIRVYGSPAEENGDGKAYMVRAGLFADVDAALQWHPSDVNSVQLLRTLANIKGEFVFTGVPAHASFSPERGRSALDGVEIMDVAVNFMREHIPSDARVHYAITDGGGAPNVVPGRAAVQYYVRHADPAAVRDIWARIDAASQGAAMAAGVKVAVDVQGGAQAMTPSATVARVAQASMERVGGITWTDDERAFAARLAVSSGMTRPLTAGAESKVVPLGAERVIPVSTDVADVSLVTPTIGVVTVAWPPQTPGHSWQAVAAAGSSIGLKAADMGARVVALTAVQLMSDPETVAQARLELESRTPKGTAYKAMFGDRAPPIPSQ